ncbi:MULTISPECIES: metallophosphoesterase [unclassified Microbacterium]|uniref:metallophosphoesterase n=1 Tax=unclassified Microbacterium TaxID=2609290 RepID=UPI00214B8E96|nr:MULTISPECIES: metallophosphoesterase [unclassified Microbacterium]MCR2783889.1 metallophosphoesterase [Microbacterium sp. zg.B96]WIM15265.1 metallophosphoesterase [Microbacterium sp. zg-B96]
MILSEYPRPRRVFVHLADTHLPGDPELLYGAADADGHLATLLKRIEASGLRPDALLLAGDLVDRGDRSAYRRLRALVEPVAERIGAEIVWAPGNHDDRAAMREELPIDDAGTADPYAPICFTRWFGGLRVLVLDSTVPGAHWGEAGPAQLEWLRDELSRPAPEGSILVVHHPPLPTVLDLAVTVELREQKALADVLRGSDVRAILAGHVHHPSFGSFAGIPVSVASSSAYGQDLATVVGSTRGHDGGQGYNLVHVYPETIVHSPVALERGANVGEHVPAAEVAARIAAAGLAWRP